MEWDDLYANYGQSKPRKNKLLFVLILVLLIGGAFVAFFIISKNLSFSKVSCDENIQQINSIAYKSDFFIPRSLESSLRTICDFQKNESLSNEAFIYVNLSNCDTGKIDNGINNPASLTLEELKTYTTVSVLYSFKEIGSYLKGIFTEEASAGCDLNKKYSFEVYYPILVATEGLAFPFHSVLTNICTESKNFTEDEKKECLVDLLGAERLVVEHYSNLDYIGNASKCVSVSGSSSSVCQKMIEYRKKLAEDIKKGNMNYNQKYFAFLVLIYQNAYLGGEEIDNKVLMNDIVNNLSNSKYKLRFTQFMTS